MGDFSIRQTSAADDSGKKIVNICGSMSIQHGEAIRTALLEALDSCQELLLDLEQVTDVDLIGLQFICSAHRTAAARQKQFSVKVDSGSLIINAATAAGFMRHVGCVQDVEHTCVWAEGGK
jgi:hypothetical protein